MTDQNTFDLFEQRVASELERYVASASDPRSAAEIADVAMRPRGIQRRVGGNLRSRRLLLFGIAAVLLVPAAVVGVGALLQKEPDPINQIQPPIAVPTFDADASPQAVDETRAIVVRRTSRGDGVSIYAVRADGAERPLREVPDSILPDGHAFEEWGTVSETGWIALADTQQPWNIVLVDLLNAQSEPWVVPDSSGGGISPVWGPQGLVAMDAAGSRAMIVDPETRTVLGTLAGGEIGGGPTIIWTEDGTGIVEHRSDGSYGVLPIDGGTFRPGFPAIFSTSGEFGDGGSGLRICVSGENCPGGDDGRVLLTELDGSSTTIWEPSTSGASSAIFGPNPGEYLVQTSADSGRKIVIERVSGDNVEVAGSIDRPTEWRYWVLRQPPADRSMLVFFVDLGNHFFATAIAPANSGTPTVHLANFAGYLGSAITDDSGDTGYITSGAEPVEPATAPYALPTIGELIGAEMALNPCCSRMVVGQSTHDAIEGDSEVEEYEVVAEAAGSPDVHLDCYGANEVTVAFDGFEVASPCTGPGGSINVFPDMEAGDVATVTASHDTTWRVVLYTNAGSVGSSPQPVAEPVRP